MSWTLNPESRTLNPALNPAADGLVRRLGRRYLLVLAAVAVLVVIDQAIVQPLLIRMNSYAPAINLAGRQRMLSQRLTKAALAWQVATNEPARRHRRDELGATLAQWSAAHWALLHGSETLGVTKLDSQTTTHLMAELEPHFQAMCAAAEEILDRSPTKDDDDANAVAAIVHHESRFLPIMDRVVKQLEHEAGRQIARLRIGGFTIAAVVIALLLGLGWFVVRPATGAIRIQVDELESRVGQRTRELAAANRALEHEILEREQAESKTGRLAAQLAHAARVSTMGHLTVGLAHEINQPLAAIANYAETCDLQLSQWSLGSSAGNGRLRRHVEQIKQAALRAGQIVRRMRRFVRPNSGSPTETDLSVLVREVAELCRFEADRAEVCLTLELSPQMLAVRVDAIQIQQVLVNLLHNAMQAMKVCSPDQRRIVIRTYGAEELAQVDVIDSGPGFRGVDPQSLFTPFNTTKPDGLGIGLAICRTIVEQHQGTIWAEPSPAGGAAIRFQLPRISTNDEACREQADCLCR